MAWNLRSACRNRWSASPEYAREARARRWGAAPRRTCSPRAWPRPPRAGTARSTGCRWRRSPARTRQRSGCGCARPRAIALPKPPMWTRTPWRTGSSSAQRSPLVATCQPMTSEVQWSTAAKNRHQPSAFVQNGDASVPRSSSGLSVRIRPLWVRSPAGMPPPHWRQQPVRPHQPQHPVPADPDPLGRQPRLHLPVALAEERTRLQHRLDLPHQLLVAQCRLRAPLPRLSAIGLWRLAESGP